MATTATKTSTRTKALAAVGVVAALGLIGYAAAVLMSKTPGKVSLKPDLEVAITSSYSSSSSSTITYEDSISYTVELKNSGKTNAENYEFSLTSDVALESVRTVSPFLTCSQTSDTTVDCDVDLTGAGASHNLEVTVENNSATTASCDEIKTVNLVGQTDTTNVIAESNETNNTDTETITLNGPRGSACIDLSVYVVGGSAPLDRGEVPIASGEEFRFRDGAFGVKNESSSDVTGQFFITYSLPDELDIVAYDTVFWCQSSEGYDKEPTDNPELRCVSNAGVTAYDTAFNAGHSYGVDVIMKNVATRAQIPCGETKDVEITATVDSDDTIDESVEGNNTATATVTLSGSCEDLDLDVADVDVESPKF